MTSPEETIRALNNAAIPFTVSYFPGMEEPYQWELIGDTAPLPGYFGQAGTYHQAIYELGRAAFSRYPSFQFELWHSLQPVGALQ